jgi:hypothetical protein
VSELIVFSYCNLSAFARNVTGVALVYTMAEFEVLFVYFLVSLVGSVFMSVLHHFWTKVKWNPYRDRDDLIRYILIASYTLRW